MCVWTNEWNCDCRVKSQGQFPSSEDITESWQGRDAPQLSQLHRGASNVGAPGPPPRPESAIACWDLAHVGGAVVSEPVSPHLPWWWGRVWPALAP